MPKLLESGEKPVTRKLVIFDDAYRMKKGIVKETTPVELNHKHVWVEKWDGSYRDCACGAHQWRLKCWTNDRWQYVTPDAVKQYRPDLRSDIDGGANYIWTHNPERVRSLDLIPEDILEEPISVVGAGGIGSFLIYTLVKMGFRKITVYDFDEVGPENVGTQFYGMGHIGARKAEKIAQLLNHSSIYKTAATVTPRSEKIRSYSLLTGLVISAVDSMSARAEIWSAAKASPSVKWFIDGRMGAEHALMYAMDCKDEKDVATYQKTLHPDEEAVQERCTAQATVYTGMMIGALIAKTVKDLLTNEPNYARIMYWNIRENIQQCYPKNYRSPYGDSAQDIAVPAV